MKKVLFVATVVKTHINAFHLPYLQYFQSLGWETSVAAKNDFALKSQCHIPFCNHFYDLPFTRNPFSKNNFKAYTQLKKLIQSNQYSIIHCHTPVGGLLTRLAARKTRKMGTRVIYTAHGFHFFKGASIINWIVYYPIEKLVARLTDDLVTINEEDYKLAKTHQFKPCSIHKVAGVGIDLSRFQPLNDEKRALVRQQLNLSKSDFVLVYVAEFISRKNHMFLLKNIFSLLESIPHLKLLLVGDGVTMNECQCYVKQNHLEDVILFAGFRNDVEKFYGAADVLISSSKQEGLPLNLIEGMACGLPVVCTDVRGNRDLVTQSKNGFLFSKERDFKEFVITLYQDSTMRKKMGSVNTLEARRYSLDVVLPQMKQIYGAKVQQIH